SGWAAGCHKGRRLGRRSRANRRRRRLSVEAIGDGWQEKGTRVLVTGVGPSPAPQWLEEAPPAQLCRIVKIPGRGHETRRDAVRLQGVVELRLGEVDRPA